MLKQIGEEGRYKNMRQMMKWVESLAEMRKLFIWASH